jgi:MYXO-CTERM domain-containing protein
VCEIYPLASDPKIYVTGPPDDGNGCTCALGGAGGAGWGSAVLLPLAGVLAARGRRRRARGG